ncbi:mitogen-activated protein kinase kinase kinase, partial [Massospora cicadina]
MISELSLDEIAIQGEERFSDVLEVEPPFAVEFEAEESFSDPLDTEPPFPVDIASYEDFYSPSSVSIPFITEDVLMEESFSDPLSLEAANDLEHTLDPFSNLLDISTEVSQDILSAAALEEDQKMKLPPVAKETNDISRDGQDQVSPLHSKSYSLAHSEKEWVYIQIATPLFPLLASPTGASKKPWNGGGPWSPTWDTFLFSQRRSSLFYDSGNRVMDVQRLGDDQAQPLHVFPRKADLSSSHRLNPKLKTSPTDSSFFGSLFPDLFRSFKYNRNPSCPVDKNKVIQISLEDGGTYSVNIGGCTSAEEISATILSSLLLDKERQNLQIEEFLVDGSTRVVSPRQLLVLCSKTDHKGLVRLMLRKLPKRSGPRSDSEQKPHGPGIGSAPQSSSTVGTVAELPSWAQMWGERPSAEMISSNLEEFFPNHDLDSPLIDEGPETPFEILGRKRSIRMVVVEAHRRMGSRLSRRNTKLWGSRITQLKDDTSMDAYSPKLESNQIPEELKNLQATTQIQWVKGKAIGKGSFGRVFHALNGVTGEMLAVKVIDLPGMKKQNGIIGRKHSDMIKELYREIELLKDLDHDNIVQYLGFEANDQSVNIFLEYVSGGSIASVLMRTGPFDELYAANLLRQTLRGLAYLHSCNILHRDIKAANVLINHEGVCKISDFGISKRNDYTRAYRYNSRMSFKGSVFWMAPEVVIDHGYSAKVDIWSLGCLLIEMLTGQRPWKEFTELAAVYKLGKSSSESAPPIPSDISEETKSFL